MWAELWFSTPITRDSYNVFTLTLTWGLSRQYKTSGLGLLRNKEDGETVITEPGPDDYCPSSCASESSPEFMWKSMSKCWIIRHVSCASACSLHAHSNSTCTTDSTTRQTPLEKNQWENNFKTPTESALTAPNGASLKLKGPAFCFPRRSNQRTLLTSRWNK